MKTGVTLISEERQEQIEKHKWNADHDFNHRHGELRKMAAILAAHGTDVFVTDSMDGDFETGKNTWGLEEKLKGKENDIHRLKVAGALIAAEIDRLQNTK